MYVSHLPGDAYVAAQADSRTNTSLAYDIDTAVLEQYNCTEVLAEETEGVGFSGGSLYMIGQVLYDDASYELLKQRQELPHWQAEYDCNDGSWISIQGWPTNEWSINQAIATRRAALDAIGITYELQEGTFIVSDDEESGITAYTSTILETDTAVYELQYSGDLTEVIR